MRLSECPVRETIEVIEGKWKPIVVNALKAGTLRFGQLRRYVPEPTRNVLTVQLRDLEENQTMPGSLRTKVRASGLPAYSLRANSRTSPDADGKMRPCPQQNKRGE